MEKCQADYLLHRIYHLLKSDKIVIVLKKLRSLKGQTDSETIWLSPKEDILPTIIHECLHVLYWNWSETKVTKTAEMVFNQLTQRQIKNLFLRLALIVNNIHYQ